MSDDLKILGVDGIRRSYDEHYDTTMDVEQDPTGAWQAIQKQADRIEELEAKLARAVAIAKDAIETMECGPFFPEREGQRLLAALTALRGQDDE